MLIDCHSEDSPTVKNNAHCSDQPRNQPEVTIDTLPDDVLLYVFDFYVARDVLGVFFYLGDREVETWHTLVHVCRRWRTLVFASPRSLNLRIACRHTTPVREKLGVWPRLPIIISGFFNYESSSTSFDNIKTALENNDRVCQISLCLAMKKQIAEVFAALEAPFPVLTNLYVKSMTSNPILPNPVKFLGGSTNLRSLSFNHIPVPGLPELLLSSTNLVNLCLDNITGSISPYAMVNALSTLTRLETLRLYFSIDSHPDWQKRRTSADTHRTVLHSLIDFRIQSFLEYLDDFMDRIDAPLLDRLDIEVLLPFLNDVVVLDTSHILRFISHVPKFQTLGEAHIGMDNSDLQMWIRFLSTRTSSGVLNLQIYRSEPEDWFQFLAQFCRSPFFPLPTLEHLYIDEGSYSSQQWPDYMENTENTRWLELLQPFTSVKNLYLNESFARRIAPALDELGGEIVTEVLPNLENLFIEEFGLYGPINEPFSNFAVFAAMRQLVRSSYVSDWGT